jgi:hypothetical protein
MTRQTTAPPLSATCRWLAGPADKGLPPDQSLADQVHALRVLADLIEPAGIPGLSLMIDPADRTNGITIQVPTYLGGLAELTAMVARLAAAVGASVTRDERPLTRGWVRADGKVDGHRVRIFAAVTADQP